MVENIDENQNDIKSKSSNTFTVYEDDTIYEVDADCLKCLDINNYANNMEVLDNEEIEDSKESNEIKENDEIEENNGMS